MRSLERVVWNYHWTREQAAVVLADSETEMLGWASQSDSRKWRNEFLIAPAHGIWANSSVEDIS